MKIQVLKKNLTEEILRKVIEIDKEFYNDFDYPEKWYFERYNKNNEIFLLVVDDEIVGYFLFYTITQRLYNDICALKYSGDYDFPISEINANSNFYYMPSVLVKEAYRKYSLPLLTKLKEETLQKENLVVIAVSEEGKHLSKLYLKPIGDVKKSTIFVKNN